MGDSPEQTAEIACYHRSPDPPPAKPYLKWYPLSKPDDIATSYPRPVAATPSEPPRRRYCQRVEQARARAMLARYQAEKEEEAKGSGERAPFDESKHKRAPAGQPNGGQFVDSATRVFQSSEGKHFLVSTDKKWRYKPSPGLHVPELSPDHVENFLDLMEQGCPA